MSHMQGTEQKERELHARDKNISILHLSCKTSDLQFSLVLQTHALVLKSVCNKEHNGVICNMTKSSSNSYQSTLPTGRVLGMNYSSFLNFTRNYEQASEIFVP